ncbi:MAG: hypothetical protein K8R46_09770 [Pirellulales bacterium]|nr:hypothetical protein [Pirellulales bacterium]
MPGLIGFTDKHHKYNGKMLLNMRSYLKHFDNYVDEDLYSDKNIYASRTHLGVIKQGSQPCILNNRFFSWLEGEFYNQEELKTKYCITSANDNELFTNIYSKTMSFDFLRDIDGYYAAALYDKKDGMVYLITDRYGFKPLYWGIINDNLIWSSELKGFLEHKDFKISIDDKAVEQFFDIGYLLEDRTWLEGVESVPPASVLSFNIKESKVEVNYYWSWSEIKPINGSIDEREIAEELGRLFKESVRKRVNKNERIGITLSGGLDSRAILAAIPEDYKPLHTFTFGQKGCDDIKIVSKVSKVKGAEHHALILSSDNWLMPRISGVWKSDGSFSLLHMHGMEFYDEYKSYIDFNLNGFLGDAILGGSYISKNQSVEYKVRNRGRRFINQALILGESWLMHRRPFFDNDLVCLMLSVPEILRQDSYIYNKTLLSTFPEYYSNIPWQNTGCPISYPDKLVKLITFKNRVVNKLKRESQRFGFNFRVLNNYTDYPAWIRQEPAISFFEKLLLNKDALYPEFIDRNKVHDYIRDHMERRSNYHNELCLALTFELWLQQVFEERYRE